MAKPKNPPTRDPSSRRGAPTKVTKPFPWGTAVGSVVLAAVLIGTVAYAATNQGAGVSDLLRSPDQAIAGIQVTPTAELTRNHVAGTVDYPTLPPNGGDHNAAPQQCAVYTAEIAPEHAVHSLEHGAVWVTYQDSVPADQIASLAGRVSNNPYRMMSPLAAQTSPIVLSAWGRDLSVDTASDPRIDDFLTAYTNGPQTPERGAACIGVTTTGPLQVAAATTPAA